MGKLDNKVALVTGGNSGIGFATAKLFAEEGAQVIIMARREKNNAEAVKEIGHGAIAIQGDVTKYEDCKRAMDEVIAKFGRIDILVNNAGQADFNRSAKNVTNEFWDEQMAVNATSVFYMSREAIKYMEPAGKGSIVNVSSIGGVYHCAGVAYSAAKAAVIAITHNMAIQYTNTGIRVNAVCPGATKTPLFSPDFADLQDKEFARITAKVVRMGLEPCEAIDQAKAILFFASDDSSAITGQYLVVDKGMCL
ncbi:MAG: SDR family NAD(P)-dependent oxidoreductase [Oscillospiraceae bacterium]